MLIRGEPVSAPDVCVQAQIAGLPTGLQRHLGLALVLTARDLAVVRQVGHRIAVLRDGRAGETGTADDIRARPRAPCTRSLLTAAPDPDPHAPRPLSAPPARTTPREAVA
ncbi:hypothetical protein GCM10018793_48110 [Streptomyces sulfonofaciens]|uniref:Uncharacterized protein n=1 Tax=Streptomyces sulfonofaciens TaxID=68272 RepID=A0A919GHT5_9ACTN|nr:hypothetical protein [Streptomyces sulfonofaciens]GHH84241.1 hypothetical protein GCM10018793_48110 [Streptomyces sulfonofaciens]